MCLPETAVSWSFVWEFFAKDVNLWAQSYLSCQRSKIQSHVKSPVHHIPVPGRRFSLFYVDMVGPLPQSNGFSYLFTQLQQRIVLKPSYVRGFLFLECVSDYLGIIHSSTTSFNPQSNGIVKRFHRQLKISLRARLAACLIGFIISIYGSTRPLEFSQIRFVNFTL